MLVLSRSDVRRLASMDDALRAAREAFVALSTGGATVPLRTAISYAEGTGLFMPAYAASAGALSLKAVTVTVGNQARGLPVVRGALILIEASTGAVLALIEATYLTALRTGAASGLAVDLLALPDADVVALFGAGATARAELWAACTVRPVREVRVVDPDRRALPVLLAMMREVLGEGCPAIRPASSPQEALAGARIVITATSSARPVFPGAALEPGTHISATGAFTPEMQELDAETVRRASLFVDARAAALSEPGDIIIPLRRGEIDERHIRAELGEVASGRHPGRQSADEITLFKSVGIAVQDLAMARAVYERAVQQGLGTELDLGEGSLT